MKTLHLLGLVAIACMTQACSSEYERIAEANECSGCDLSDVDLSAIGSFNGTDLSGARLIGANLTNVMFSNVNLSDAVIEKTKFTNVSFENVDFSGAVVSETSFAETTFKDSDFTGAKITALSDGLVSISDSSVTNTMIKFSGFHLILSNLELGDSVDIVASTNILEISSVTGGSKEIISGAQHLKLEKVSRLMVNSLLSRLDELQVKDVDHLSVSSGKDRWDGMQTGVELFNVSSVQNLVVEEVGPSVIDLVVHGQFSLVDVSLEKSWLSDSLSVKYIGDDTLVKKRWSEFAEKSSNWKGIMNNSNARLYSEFSIRKDGSFPPHGYFSSVYEKRITELKLSRWRVILRNTDRLSESRKDSWIRFSESSDNLSESARQWLDRFTSGEVNKFSHEVRKAAYYESGLQFCTSPEIPRQVNPSDLLSSRGAKLFTTSQWFDIPNIENNIERYNVCIEEGFDKYHSEIFRNGKGLEELASALNASE